MGSSMAIGQAVVLRPGSHCQAGTERWYAHRPAFEAGNRALPPTLRRMVPPLGTIVEHRVSPPVSCSAESVSGAREMVTGDRTPLSGAALEGSGAETAMCNEVSGCVVPAIGARGLAIVTMLLVTKATTAMTSTRKIYW